MVSILRPFLPCTAVPNWISPALLPRPSITCFRHLPFCGRGAPTRRVGPVRDQAKVTGVGVTPSPRSFSRNPRSHRDFADNGHRKSNGFLQGLRRWHADGVLLGRPAPAGRSPHHGDLPDRQRQSVDGKSCPSHTGSLPLTAYPLELPRSTGSSTSKPERRGAWPCRKRAGV